MSTKLDRKNKLSKVDLSAKSNEEIPDFGYEEIGFLRALIGSDAIKSEIVVSIAFDNEERTITIDPLSNTIENALQVDFSAKLTNTDLDTLLVSPDLVSSGASIERLHIGVHDLGGLDRLLAHVAREQGTTPEFLKQMMRRELTIGLGQFGIDAADAQANVSMLDEPGQKLSLDITTAPGFSLEEAQYQAMMNPLELTKNITVEINVEK